MTKAFFVCTALFHLASIVARFDDAAAALPSGVTAGLLLATFPLIFLEGWIDAAEDDEKARSIFAKASFTFAFSFLAVVLVQTWDVEIGPLNPSPPKEWPLTTRLRFFLMMSVGLAFPFWLASRSLLVPALRALGRAARKLGALGPLLLVVAGLVLGLVVVVVLANKTAGDEVKGLKAAWKSFVGTPWIAFLVTGFGVVVPLVFERIRQRDEV